jgi:hypothetical protein
MLDLVLVDRDREFSTCGRKFGMRASELTTFWSAELGSLRLSTVHKRWTDARRNSL